MASFCVYVEQMWTNASSGVWCGWTDPLSSGIVSATPCHTHLTHMLSHFFSSFLQKAVMSPYWLSELFSSSRLLHQVCRRRCFVQVWPLAVRAEPATLAWVTWRWVAASWRRPSAATTAPSSTAPTRTPTPTWPAAPPSAPNATPASLSCPTWPGPCPTPPSATPTPGGSRPRGWSLRRCSWTSRPSSTSRISSWCSARRGPPPWRWSGRRTSGERGRCCSTTPPTAALPSGWRRERRERVGTGPPAPPNTPRLIPATVERWGGSV